MYYFFLIPLLVIGCGGTERKEPRNFSIILEPSSQTPLVITEVKIMSRKDEWRQWERIHRFTIEKKENLMTGLYTLVISDLWQKQNAAIAGLRDDEYESVRQGLILQITAGRSPALDWQKEGDHSVDCGVTRQLN